MPDSQPFSDIAFRGVEIQLMVLTEVNSRTAKPGERFKLRVNEPVSVDGKVVVPVGATAWAEVTSATATSVAGGKGRLGARLLFVDLPQGPLPLSGAQGTEGRSNADAVAMGFLGFGLAGLLVKGNNATFKAGALLTGYIDAGTAPKSSIPLQVTG
jgi:hypothetical protein